MKWCSKHLCKGVEKPKCLDKMCMGILCWNKIWVFLCDLRCHSTCFQLVKGAGEKKSGSIDFSSWEEKKKNLFLNFVQKDSLCVGLPRGWSLNYYSTVFSSGTVTYTLLIHWECVIRMTIPVVLHVVQNKCQHQGLSVCLGATLASVWPIYRRHC